MTVAVLLVPVGEGRALRLSQPSVWILIPLMLRANITGGDTYAQKAVCLEISHMNAVIDANVPQLHITLSAVFYIRGKIIAPD